MRGGCHKTLPFFINFTFMSYEADDFNKCPWNPMIDSGNVMDLWKPFKSYPEFEPKYLSGEKSKFLNFVCMAYHKNSPLINDYNNPQERKRMAASLAGFRAKGHSGLFRPEVENFINGENEIANKMIIRFLWLQDSMKFTALMVAYKNIDKLLFRIEKSSDRENLEDAIDETTKDINKLYTMLDMLETRKQELMLGDEDVIKAADGILAHIAVVPPGWPERQAQKDFEDENSKF